MTEEPVWVRGSTTRLDPDGPVPLVSYGGDSACQRIAVAALHRAGLDCNFVFTAHSLVSQTAAVEAGFGVMVMPRSRAVRNRLAIWEDGPLPKLPRLYGAICIRDGGGTTAIAELADKNRLCLRCHDEDNSPKFDFSKYWGQIVHKGLDNPKEHMNKAAKVARQDGK